MARALDDLANQLPGPILRPNPFIRVPQDRASEIRQGEVEVAGAQVDPYYLAEAGVDPDLRASLAEDQEAFRDQRPELAQQRLRLNAKSPGEPAD
jgi:hypothetical protein